MAFLEIRASTPISVFLIVLGLPASVAFLGFGLCGLLHPFHPDGGFGAGLVFCGMGLFLLLMAVASFRGILRRNKNPIRTSTAIAVFFIVLGLPASVAFVLFGLACLEGRINPELGVVAGLVFCGMGMFILLMAIAAFRGILRTKKSRRGEHPT